MARQFATMIDSGLSLLKALSILQEQTPNPELRRVLGEIGSDIEAGASLSSSLAKHPNVFPPLFVNMCRAGEVGGFLDEVLGQIADNYEAEVKLHSKVKSAMTYPVIVFIMAILAVLGMLLFIVPVFAQMFASLGGQLPAPTQFPRLPVGRSEVPHRASDRGVHRFDHLVAQVQEPPQGPELRRSAQAEAADLRWSHAEDRHQSLHPQPGHDAQLGRPDPAGARHRRGHLGQRRRGTCGARGAGERA